MFDSHCHLTSARFDADRALALQRMAAAGIGGCLTIGTGLDDALAARALATAHPGVIWASAGIDPFSARDSGAAFPEHLAGLQRLLAQGGFVALGECGLEHHHPLDPPAVQHERFAAQAALARTLGLPLVVHARSGPHGGDAHAPAVAVVRSLPGLRGVIHSFDGDAGQARAWLDAGFHIAFNGMATFKHGEALRAAARIVPADRLLLETDAPYLAPAPRRGRRNEPAFLPHIAAVLAEQRGERDADLLAWAGRNAAALFGAVTSPAGGG